MPSQGVLMFGSRPATMKPLKIMRMKAANSAVPKWFLDRTVVAVVEILDQ